MAVAVACICIFVLPRIIRFFLPFVIGWIIAMIANPIVKWMEKRVKIVRKHSSVIIIIAGLGIVVGIIYLGISALGREIISLLTDLPDIYNSMELKLADISKKMNGIYKVMPENAKNVMDSFWSNANKYVTDFISNNDVPSISSAGNIAKNLADGLFMAVISLLSAYFFIAEREKMMIVYRKMTPKVITEKIDIIMDNFKRAFGGYFKAQFKIMLVILLILFVGFELLRVPYSFLLALVVAILDLLPFFGTGAVIWPWAVFELISGNYVKAICLMVIYLVCQVVKQVLQPKMVGDSIGLSPLATLIFMFIGYRFSGLLGLIIGIPVGMIVVNFYRSGVFDNIIRGAKIIAHDLSEFMKF